MGVARRMTGKQLKEDWWIPADQVRRNEVTMRERDAQVRTTPLYGLVLAQGNRWARGLRQALEGKTGDIAV
jgi:hypothetical protein